MSDPTSDDLRAFAIQHGNVSVESEKWMLWAADRIDQLEKRWSINELAQENERLRADRKQTREFLAEALAREDAKADRIDQADD